MTMTAASRVLDRAALLERFHRIRARTRMIFDVLDESCYLERPIALRNPVVFYEGHLPAFAVNTFLRRALGQPGVDAHLETIFARGIDPETEALAVARGNPAWPDRRTVRDYAAEVERRIAAAITEAEIARDGDPLRHRGQALWAILEHEEMHQETLAYMWHQIPPERKRAPAGYETATPRPGATYGAEVEVPPGMAMLGTDLEAEPFAWDNELPPHRVPVDAFAIDVHNVTNGAFLEFVEAGGYTDRRWWRPDDWEWVQTEQVSHPPFWERDNGAWRWRGMFARVALPLDWPVYVTWAEAVAFARWRGCRLPTEAEYHRAAFGTPRGDERVRPRDDTGRGVTAGNYDFRRWDPEPIGLSPGAASAFGVHDLIGNGWEWTATPFGPFPGFEPIPSYPEYSADFFDNDHFVMKGASPVTAAPLVRRGFRNWFRPRYPYVYAAFRCTRAHANQ